MLRHRIWYFFPLAFYLVLIFYLSSRPAFAIRHDKIGHTLEYAGLGFLIARLFVWRLRGAIRPMGIVLGSVLLGMIYGMTDEFHQSFVPGRESSGWDVMADAFGSLLGALSYVLYHYLKRTITSRA